MEAPYEVWLIGPVVSEEKMFENIDNTDIYDRGLPIL